MITMMTALAAAGGYCSAATSFCSAETTDALWPPLMVRTTKELPMTSVTTKIEPSAIPLLLSGSTISAHHPEAAGARVVRRLEQAFVDARHGIEDRHHHEQREQMDIGHDHGEVGEQQELQRLAG